MQRSQGHCWLTFGGEAIVWGWCWQYVYNACIDRLKDQRDKAESEHQEECELHIQKNQDQKIQLDKLQIELTEKQVCIENQE